MENKKRKTHTLLEIMPVNALRLLLPFIIISFYFYFYFVSSFSVHCIVFNQLINDFVRVVKRKEWTEQKRKNTQNWQILTSSKRFYRRHRPEQINKYFQESSNGQKNVSSVFGPEKMKHLIIIGHNNRIAEGCFVHACIWHAINTIT